MTYQVKIDIFEGPLDLLLFLIQKDDLDIYDIPISQITSAYVSYIDLMKELNLSLAGEFLVMAATLMQIKAKTLLPVEPGPQDGETGPDPRADLVRKLLEYQRFKQAARTLGERFETNRGVYYRGAPVFNTNDQVLDVSLGKLIDAFRSVLESADEEVRDFIMEEIPVEVRIREILDVLESREHVAFVELFPVAAGRKALIVTFLALLELIRLHQVRVVQTANFSDIYIQKAPQQEEADTLALT